MTAEPVISHIRWRVDSKWAGNFHAIADSPTENGSLALRGAEPTDDDEVWRMCGPRHPENLATITCGECKRLRQLGYSPNPIEGVTLVPNLAQRILDRITADPDAFNPGAWFTIQTSHAIWPEDTIDGNDVSLGLAAWACHLSGWHLTRDDMGQPYAYQPHDDDGHRDIVELAVELLGLDNADLLDRPDRETAIAGLRALANP